MANNYNFISTRDLIIRNALISELEQIGKAAIFVGANTLRKEPTGGSINVKFDTAAKTDTQVSDTILNFKFSPTNYVNKNGVIQQTPELEIPLCNCNVGMQNLDEIKNLINQEESLIVVKGGTSNAIRITGLLVGNRDRVTKDNPLGGKPVDDMRKLTAIYKSKQTIDVVSPFLSVMGIQRLYIRWLEFHQDLVKKNVQGFTMNCYTQSADNQSDIILR